MRPSWSDEDTQELPVEELRTRIGAHRAIRSHRAPVDPYPRWAGALLAVAIVVIGGALLIRPTAAESSTPQGDVYANGQYAMYTENYCTAVRIGDSARRSEAAAALRDVALYRGVPYVAPVCTTQPPPSSPAATTPPATTPPATTEPPATTPPATTEPPVTTPPATTPPPGPCLDALRRADRCGWPTAATTGPRSPVALTNYTGPLPLVIPAGQTRSGLIVPGCVRLQTGAALVDSIVRPTASTLCGGYAAIDQEWPSIQHNVALRFVEVDLHLAGSNRMNIRAITGDGFELDHVHCWGGADCVHYGGEVYVHDSYLHTPPCLTVQSASVCNGYHIDALHSASAPYAGALILIVHNTIVAEENTPTNYATSAWINGPDMTAYGGFVQSNVHGIDNLLAGGGFTQYCEAHEEQASSVPIVEYTGNRFSDLYYPNSGYWGASTGCKNNVPNYSGNVYDRTGAPI